MLASIRGARLCSKCRQDLLKVFERGFRGPPASQPSLSPVHRCSDKPARRPAARFFSVSSQYYQQEPSSHRNEDQGTRDEDLIERNEAGEDQLEAVRELEKALGRPLQDAIDHDRLAAQADRVASIRNSGAGPDEVAREARLFYGNSLPEGALNDEELTVYQRLYGQPDPSQENEGDLDNEEDYISAEQEILDENGEPIDMADIDNAQELGRQYARRLMNAEHTQGKDSDDGVIALFDSNSDLVLSVAKSVDGQVLAPSEDLDNDMTGSSEERTHHLTRIGKFGTSPSTLNLPKDRFIEPLNKSVKDGSNKHLKEVSERVFGGGGLPDSPLTPRSGRTRPQSAVPLEASQFFMTETEANAFATVIMPPAYAAIMSVLVETRKRLGPTWLTELLARDGGPRVLDAGAGGAGIVAWNEIVRAHWTALHTSDKKATPPPQSKCVVLTGSDPLRHRAASLLDNTTFIPRLPDYTRTRDSPTLDDDRPAQRKQFDIVIAPYTLLAQKEDWERKLYVQNLWTLVSSSGGVLLLIEKGMPRGFEVIAGARELLLERHISSPLSHNTHYSLVPDSELDPMFKQETGMIIAPCTNHNKCPLYRIPGVSQGRKDFCSFQQRYIRPFQLQRLLGATDRNHDDVDFSYVSVLKGKDLRNHELSSIEHLLDPMSATPTSNPDSYPIPSEAWIEDCQEGFDTKPEAADTIDPPHDPTSYPPPHLLPRLLYPPMKRPGHIILDVCTPLGTIERWTVPRSFSRRAFRDARKAQWGDLWALGAKTRIPRSIKTGVSSMEVERVMHRMPGGGGGRGIGTKTGAVSEKGRKRD
jgi:ribosomal protein RSM22 (predicted rRNA methylase)